MKAVILAAGVGSRLGRPFPKCLNILPGDETILGRQVRILRKNGIDEIYVVVGFKMSLIMEKEPDTFFCYNPLYYITNTSKSLLQAMRFLCDDIIWINGDTVFDERILPALLNLEGNVVCVNEMKCGQEEVKYKLNSQGKICQISKNVTPASGEAVGINKISKKNSSLLTEKLRIVDDNDYFERAIELMIDDGIDFSPLNVSDYCCIEVDFEEDWENVVSKFSTM